MPRRSLPNRSTSLAGPAIERPLKTWLLTVGHGTASAEQFAALLRRAGVTDLVDIRSVPGSRHNPQFGQAEMALWLPQAGIAYTWEPALGGFRKTSPTSPNVALRHASFRGYADYMQTPAFTTALADLRQLAREREVAVMCAETLWWRCHRRLVADAAVLWGGATVEHLMPDGHLQMHRLTEGARLDPEGTLAYDGVPTPTAPMLLLEPERAGAAKDRSSRSNTHDAQPKPP
jgi:uncharacterized protein (DUF488 family)